MRPHALQVIQDEHQAVSAMLRSLNMLLRKARDEKRAPPFDVLRAMLFYVDEFPERLHHPKETQLLFPKVRARCPQLGPVLDQLDADHHMGEASIRELEHRMLAYEVMGESRRVAFETELQCYVDFYLQHMATEETELLPAVDRCLLPADRAALDEQFAANRDPLTGHPVPDAYRPLFSKIVNATPAPIGLGPER